MGKVFLITEEQGEALVKYLLKQPYQDVRSLIMILEQLPTANIITEPETVSGAAEEAKEVTQ